MPQGIQVKDEVGNIILDTNDNVVQYKDRLSTTTEDGSFVFNDFPVGNAKFFYVTVPIDYTEGNKLLPEVKWNPATKTISWAFLRFEGVTQAPAVIFYGYV